MRIVKSLSAELDALVQRARRLAHLEAQIPEPIEQELGHLLVMRRRLVGVEEEDIDVGMGRQLAAAVATDREQRQLLAAGRVGDRVDPALGKVHGTREHGVDQPRMIGGELDAVAGGVERLAQPRIALVERMAHAIANRRRDIRRGHRVVERGGDGLPVAVDIERRRIARRPIGRCRRTDRGRRLPHGISGSSRPIRSTASPPGSSVLQAQPRPAGRKARRAQPAAASTATGNRRKR